MEQYYILFRNVSLFLLSAFETAYHLPPQTLTSKVSHDASEVRINHYTDIDIADIRKGGVTRISPHTDLGVITCLFQDGSGGLEMEDREHKGEFIPIPSDSPFEMIVNISETFQRWTNDKLPAGVHQVTIPQHMKHLDKGIIPSRYSSACFVKANRDAMVGPLSEFVSEKEPAVYDYISALEYHQRRITSAYLRQA
jgi:isopenicillin N synthase-like dioxygenase